MIEQIAFYLAGLSFFFTGVAGISENLRQVSGQRFRLLLAHATTHPVMAGLLGVALGAVTQSTSIVAFLLSGMVATGLLPMGRALIVLACSNIGTAVLVFIASVDLHLPTLLLIGICGLMIAFRILARYTPVIAGLLSIGLVFFGLDMMKQAFAPLSTSSSAQGVARFLDYFPDAAFLIGVAMRSLVHSSAAAGAITITINHGNTFGDFQAMMSMAGLGVGTAIATYFLSSNLSGVPRQIALYQALTNVIAGFVVAALLIVERAFHLPLILTLLHHLANTISRQMAIMFLLFNVSIALVSVAIQGWAPAWLAKKSPSTLEEDLSRPQYLQAQALLSPETALDLVALEQLRIVRALALYLEAVRGDESIKLARLHEASNELAAEIARFLEALVHLRISKDLAVRVISFQRKEETLRSLEENVFLFSETLTRHPGQIELAGRLVEALDTILLTAIDALQSRDELDLQMLVQLTDDRGGMMEKLRNRHQVDESRDVHDVSALHYSTTLFERNVWLLRQLALWIREDVKATA